MRFTETEVAGAFLIDQEPIEDERGFFARTWCRREFSDRGLSLTVAQCSVSFNLTRGTLRGLHYQAPPYQETKVVRATTGAIFDVVLDLRPASATFARHAGATLSAANRRMLYIPEGCAHGFLTLENDTEVAYQMSEFHAPDANRGVRWDDPAFQIRWPGEVRVIAERDRAYPDIDLAMLARRR